MAASPGGVGTGPETACPLGQSDAPAGLVSSVRAWADAPALPTPVSRASPAPGTEAPPEGAHTIADGSPPISVTAPLLKPAFHAR